MPVDICGAATFKEETSRSGSDDKEKSRLGSDAPISEAACSTSATFCSGDFFSAKYAPPPIIKEQRQLLPLKPTEPLTKIYFYSWFIIMPSMVVNRERVIFLRRRFTARC